MTQIVWWHGMCTHTLHDGKLTHSLDGIAWMMKQDTFAKNYLMDCRALVCLQCMSDWVQ